MSEYSNSVQLCPYQLPYVSMLTSKLNAYCHIIIYKDYKRQR